MKLSTPNNNNQNVMQYLYSIYGIKGQKCLRICDDLGLCPQNLYRNVSPRNRNRIYFYIQQHFFVGEKYKSLVKNDISRYITISSYKGIRHTRGLPCRGQRTHGNAKTARKVGLYQNKNNSKKKLFVKKK